MRGSMDTKRNITMETLALRDAIDGKLERIEQIERRTVGRPNQMLKDAGRLLSHHSLTFVIDNERTNRPLP